MNRKTFLFHVLTWIILVLATNLAVGVIFGKGVESSVIIASQFSIPTAYFVTVIQLYQLARKGIQALNNKIQFTKMYFINLVVLWVIFFLINKII